MRTVKNIALFCGGNSGEAAISIFSANEVKANIDRKYNVYCIVVEGWSWYYEHNGIRTEVDKNEFALLLDEKVCFDVAFIMIHGTPGENGLLQAYLEMKQVPFTTCSSLVSAVTFDKVICNAVVRDLKLVNVARNVSFYEKNRMLSGEIVNQLSLPLFVKPAAGGSSIGISRVEDEKDLNNAIDMAFKEDKRVIIEEYIRGREFSCGVFQDETVVAFPVTEIISQKSFFDYEAKYEGKSQEVTPAQINTEISNLIQQTAIKIYSGLNCRGVCRIDFIFNDEEQKLYFLEINTVPGQSSESIVPKQVRAMKWRVADLYEKLIQSASY